MIGTIRISQIPPASPLSGSEDFIVNQSGATRLTSLDNVVGFVSFVPSSGISSYSDVAGISTFANVAGISTYSGVAGISTVSGGLTGTPNISVGIITATSLIASGIVSAMSGFNLGISSVGVAITNGPIKTLNFIGAGNTFSVDGNVVNISITSSTNISYASTTRTLNSSTGIGTQLPLVTSTAPGLAPSAGTPGADQLFFWDHSAQAYGYATIGPGVVMDGTTLRAEEWLWVACSDEDTALTTGTAKITFRLGYAATLLAVRASVKTAPTGSNLIVDVNEAGVSVLSTKLSIDATEKTSTTAATAAVISDSALADDAEITVDIDQVGSTVAGSGLKVGLYLRRV